jgi:hypothetical protein
MNKKMIRFINSRYEDLFLVPDGGNVVLSYSDGVTVIRTCRYIDEYHTQVGARIFHICEFAELMERNGTKYAPQEHEKQVKKAAGLEVR